MKPRAIHLFFCVCFCVVLAVVSFIFYFASFNAKAATTVTISWVSNNSFPNPDPTTGNSGDPIVLPDEFNVGDQINGYTFQGWRTGNAFAPNQTGCVGSEVTQFPVQNAIYYACWLDKTPPNQPATALAPTPIIDNPTRTVSLKFARVTDVENVSSINTLKYRIFYIKKISSGLTISDYSTCTKSSYIGNVVTGWNYESSTSGSDDINVSFVVNNPGVWYYGICVKDLAGNAAPLTVGFFNVDARVIYNELGGSDLQPTEYYPISSGENEVSSTIPIPNYSGTINGWEFQGFVAPNGAITKSNTQQMCSSGNSLTVYKYGTSNSNFNVTGDTTFYACWLDKSPPVNLSDIGFSPTTASVNDTSVTLSYPATYDIGGDNSVDPTTATSKLYYRVIKAPNASGVNKCDYGNYGGSLISDWRSYNTVTYDTSNGLSPGQNYITICAKDLANNISSGTTYLINIKHNIPSTSSLILCGTNSSNIGTNSQKCTPNTGDYAWRVDDKNRSQKVRLQVSLNNTTGQTPVFYGKAEVSYTQNGVNYHLEIPSTIDYADEWTQLSTNVFNHDFVLAQSIYINNTDISYHYYGSDDGSYAQSATSPPQNVTVETIPSKTLISTLNLDQKSTSQNSSFQIVVVPLNCPLSNRTLQSVAPNNVDFGTDIISHKDSNGDYDCVFNDHGNGAGSIDSGETNSQNEVIKFITPQSTLTASVILPDNTSNVVNCDLSNDYQDQIYNYSYYISHNPQSQICTISYYSLHHQNKWLPLSGNYQINNVQYLNNGTSFIDSYIAQSANSNINFTIKKTVAQIMVDTNAITNLTVNSPTSNNNESDLAYVYLTVPTGLYLQSPSANSLCALYDANQTQINNFLMSGASCVANSLSISAAPAYTIVGDGANNVANGYTQYVYFVHVLQDLDNDGNIDKLQSGTHYLYVSNMADNLIDASVVTSDNDFVVHSNLPNFYLYAFSGDFLNIPIAANCNSGSPENDMNCYKGSDANLIKNTYLARTQQNPGFDISDITTSTTGNTLVAFVGPDNSSYPNLFDSNGEVNITLTQVSGSGSLGQDILGTSYCKQLPIFDDTYGDGYGMVACKFPQITNSGRYVYRVEFVPDVDSNTQKSSDIAVDYGFVDFSYAIWANNVVKFKFTSPFVNNLSDPNTVDDAVVDNNQESFEDLVKDKVWTASNGGVGTGSGVDSTGQCGSYGSTQISSADLPQDASNDLLDELNVERQCVKIQGFLYSSGNFNNDNTKKDLLNFSATSIRSAQVSSAEVQIVENATQIADGVNVLSNANTCGVNVQKCYRVPFEFYLPQFTESIAANDVGYAVSFRYDPAFMTEISTADISSQISRIIKPKQSNVANTTLLANSTAESSMSCSQPNSQDELPECSSAKNDYFFRSIVPFIPQGLTPTQENYAKFSINKCIDYININDICNQTQNLNLYLPSGISSSYQNVDLNYQNIYAGLKYSTSLSTINAKKVCVNGPSQDGIHCSIDDLVDDSPFGKLTPGVYQLCSQFLSNSIYSSLKSQNDILSCKKIEVIKAAPAPSTTGIGFINGEAVSLTSGQNGVVKSMTINPEGLTPLLEVNQGVIGYRVCLGSKTIANFNEAVNCDLVAPDVVSQIVNSGFTFNSFQSSTRTFDLTLPVFYIPGNYQIAILFTNDISMQNYYAILDVSVSQAISATSIVDCVPNASYLGEADFNSQFRDNTCDNSMLFDRSRNNQDGELDINDENLLDFKGFSGSSSFVHAENKVFTSVSSSIFSDNTNIHTNSKLMNDSSVESQITPLSNDDAGEAILNIYQSDGQLVRSLSHKIMQSDILSAVKLNYGSINGVVKNSAFYGFDISSINQNDGLSQGDYYLLGCFTGDRSLSFSCSSKTNRSFLQSDFIATSGADAFKLSDAAKNELFASDVSRLPFRKISILRAPLGHITSYFAQSTNGANTERCNSDAIPETLDNIQDFCIYVSTLTPRTQWMSSRLDNILPGDIATQFYDDNTLLHQKVCNSFTKTAQNQYLCMIELNASLNESLIKKIDQNVNIQIAQSDTFISKSETKTLQINPSKADLIPEAEIVCRDSDCTDIKAKIIIKSPTNYAGNTIYGSGDIEVKIYSPGNVDITNVVLTNPNFTLYNGVAQFDMPDIISLYGLGVYTIQLIKYDGDETFLDYSDSLVPPNTDSKSVLVEVAANHFNTHIHISKSNKSQILVSDDMEVEGNVYRFSDRDFATDHRAVCDNLISGNSNNYRILLYISDNGVDFDAETLVFTSEVQTLLNISCQNSTDDADDYPAIKYIIPSSVFNQNNTGAGLYRYEIKYLGRTGFLPSSKSSIFEVKKVSSSDAQLPVKLHALISDHKISTAQLEQDAIINLKVPKNVKPIADTQIRCNISPSDIIDQNSCASQILDNAQEGYMTVKHYRLSPSSSRGFVDYLESKVPILIRDKTLCQNTLNTDPLTDDLYDCYYVVVSMPNYNSTPGEYVLQMQYSGNAYVDSIDANVVDFNQSFYDVVKADSFLTLNIPHQIFAIDKTEEEAQIFWHAPDFSNGCSNKSLFQGGDDCYSESNYSSVQMSKNPTMQSGGKLNYYITKGNEDDISNALKVDQIALQSQNPNLNRCKMSFNMNQIPNGTADYNCFGYLDNQNTNNIGDNPDSLFFKLSLGDFSSLGAGDYHLFVRYLDDQNFDNSDECIFEQNGCKINTGGYKGDGYIKSDFTVYAPKPYYSSDTEPELKVYQSQMPNASDVDAELEFDGALDGNISANVEYLLRYHNVLDNVVTDWATEELNPLPSGVYQACLPTGNNLIDDGDYNKKLFCEHKGLLAGETYEFAVTPKNAYGFGKTLLSKYTVPLHPPSIPGNVDAKDELKIKVEQNELDIVKIQTLHAYTDAKNFELYAEEIGQTANYRQLGTLTANLDQNGIVYLSTNDVSPNECYYFKIRIVNPSGSIFSDEFPFCVASKFDTIDETLELNSSNSVKFIFSKPQVNGLEYIGFDKNLIKYQIYVKKLSDNSNVFSCDLSSQNSCLNFISSTNDLTTLILPNLEYDQEYSFEVKAVGILNNINSKPQNVQKVAKIYIPPLFQSSPISISQTVSQALDGKAEIIWNTAPNYSYKAFWKYHNDSDDINNWQLFADDNRSGIAITNNLSTKASQNAPNEYDIEGYDFKVEPYLSDTNIYQPDVYLIPDNFYRAAVIHQPKISDIVVNNLQSTSTNVALDIISSLTDYETEPFWDVPLLKYYYQVFDANGDEVPNKSGVLDAGQTNVTINGLNPNTKYTVDLIACALLCSRSFDASFGQNVITPPVDTNSLVKPQIVNIQELKPSYLQDKNDEANVKIFWINQPYNAIGVYQYQILAQNVSLANPQWQILKTVDGIKNCQDVWNTPSDPDFTQSQTGLISENNSDNICDLVSQRVLSTNISNLYQGDKANWEFKINLVTALNNVQLNSDETNLYSFAYQPDALSLLTQIQTTSNNLNGDLEIRFNPSQYSGTNQSKLDLLAEDNDIYSKVALNQTSINSMAGVPTPIIVSEVKNSQNKIIGYNIQNLKVGQKYRFGILETSFYMNYPNALSNVDGIAYQTFNTTNALDEIEIIAVPKMQNALSWGLGSYADGSQTTNVRYQIQLPDFNSIDDVVVESSTDNLNFTQIYHKSVADVANDCVELSPGVKTLILAPNSANVLNSVPTDYLGSLTQGQTIYFKAFSIKNNLISDPNLLQIKVVESPNKPGDLTISNIKNSSTLNQRQMTVNLPTLESLKQGTWTNSSDGSNIQQNVTVMNYLDYSTDDFTTYNSIGLLSTDISKLFDNLPSNTTYYFRIRAVTPSDVQISNVSQVSTGEYKTSPIIGDADQEVEVVFDSDNMSEKFYLKLEFTAKEDLVICEINNVCYARQDGDRDTDTEPEVRIEDEILFPNSHAYSQKPALTDIEPKKTNNIPIILCVRDSSILNQIAYRCEAVIGPYMQNDIVKSTVIITEPDIVRNIALPPIQMPNLPDIPICDPNKSDCSGINTGITFKSLEGEWVNDGEISVNIPCSLIGNYSTTNAFYVITVNQYSNSSSHLPQKSIKIPADRCGSDTVIGNILPDIDAEALISVELPIPMASESCVVGSNDYNPQKCLIFSPVITSPIYLHTPYPVAIPQISLIDNGLIVGSEKYSQNKIILYSKFTDLVYRGSEGLKWQLQSVLSDGNGNIEPGESWQNVQIFDGGKSNNQIESYLNNLELDKSYLLRVKPIYLVNNQTITSIQTLNTANYPDLIQNAIANQLPNNNKVEITHTPSNYLNHLNDSTIVYQYCDTQLGCSPNSLNWHLIINNLTPNLVADHIYQFRIIETPNIDQGDYLRTITYLDKVLKIVDHGKITDLLPEDLDTEPEIVLNPDTNKKQVYIAVDFVAHKDLVICNANSQICFARQSLDPDTDTEPEVRIDHKVTDQNNIEHPQTLATTNLNPKINNRPLIVCQALNQNYYSCHAVVGPYYEDEKVQIILVFNNPQIDNESQIDDPEIGPITHLPDPEGPCDTKTQKCTINPEDVDVEPEDNFDDNGGGLVFTISCDAIKAQYPNLDALQYVLTVDIYDNSGKYLGQQTVRVDASDYDCSKGGEIIITIPGPIPTDVDAEPEISIDVNVPISNPSPCQKHDTDHCMTDGPIILPPVHTPKRINPINLHYSTTNQIIANEELKNDLISISLKFADQIYLSNEGLTYCLEYKKLSEINYHNYQCNIKGGKSNDDIELVVNNLSQNSQYEFRVVPKYALSDVRDYGYLLTDLTATKPNVLSDANVVQTKLTQVSITHNGSTYHNYLNNSSIDYHYCDLAKNCSDASNWLISLTYQIDNLEQNHTYAFEIWESPNVTNNQNIIQKTVLYQNITIDPNFNLYDLMSSDGIGEPEVGGKVNLTIPKVDSSLIVCFNSANNRIDINDIINRAKCSIRQKDASDIDSEPEVVLFDKVNNGVWSENSQISQIVCSEDSNNNWTCQMQINGYNSGDLIQMNLIVHIPHGVSQTNIVKDCFDNYMLLIPTPFTADFNAIQSGNVVDNGVYNYQISLAAELFEEDINQNILGDYNSIDKNEFRYQIFYTLNSTLYTIELSQQDVVLLEQGKYKVNIERIGNIPLNSISITLKVISPSNLQASFTKSLNLFEPPIVEDVKLTQILETNPDDFDNLAEVKISFKDDSPVLNNSLTNYKIEIIKSGQIIESYQNDANNICSNSLCHIIRNSFEPDENYSVVITPNNSITGKGGGVNGKNATGSIRPISLPKLNISASNNGKQIAVIFSANRLKANVSNSQIDTDEIFTFNVKYLTRISSSSQWSPNPLDANWQNCPVINSEKCLIDSPNNAYDYIFEVSLKSNYYQASTTVLSQIVNPVILPADISEEPLKVTQSELGKINVSSESWGGVGGVYKIEYCITQASNTDLPSSCIWSQLAQTNNRPVAVLNNALNNRLYYFRASLISAQGLVGQVNGLNIASIITADIPASNDFQKYVDLSLIQTNYQEVQLNWTFANYDGFDESDIHFTVLVDSVVEESYEIGQNCIYANKTKVCQAVIRGLTLDTVHNFAIFASGLASNYGTTKTLSIQLSSKVAQNLTVRQIPNLYTYDDKAEVHLEFDTEANVNYLVYADSQKVCEIFATSAGKMGCDIVNLDADKTYEFSVKSQFYSVISQNSSSALLHTAQIPQISIRARYDGLNIVVDTQFSRTKNSLEDFESEVRYCYGDISICSYQNNWQLINPQTLLIMNPKKGQYYFTVDGNTNFYSGITLTDLTDFVLGNIVDYADITAEPLYVEQKQLQSLDIHSLPWSPYIIDEAHYYVEYCNYSLTSCLSDDDWDEIPSNSRTSADVVLTNLQNNSQYLIRGYVKIDGESNSIVSPITKFNTADYIGNYITIENVELLTISTAKVRFKFSDYDGFDENMVSFDVVVNGQLYHLNALCLPNNGLPLICETNVNNLQIGNNNISIRGYGQINNTSDSSNYLLNIPDALFAPQVSISQIKSQANDAKYTVSFYKPASGTAKLEIYQNNSLTAQIVDLTDANICSEKANLKIECVLQALKGDMIRAELSVIDYIQNVQTVSDPNVAQIVLADHPDTKPLDFNTIKWTKVTDDYAEISLSFENSDYSSEPNWDSDRMSYHISWLADDGSFGNITSDDAKTITFSNIPLINQNIHITLTPSASLTSLNPQTINFRTSGLIKSQKPQKVAETTSSLTIVANNLLTNYYSDVNTDNISFEFAYKEFNTQNPFVFSNCLPTNNQCETSFDNLEAYKTYEFYILSSTLAGTTMSDPLIYTMQIIPEIPNPMPPLLDEVNYSKAVVDQTQKNEVIIGLTVPAFLYSWYKNFDAQFFDFYANGELKPNSCSLVSQSAPTGPTTSLECIITGLNNGDTYIFDIESSANAINKLGLGAQSSITTDAFVLVSEPVYSNPQANIQIVYDNNNEATILLPGVWSAVGTRQDLAQVNEQIWVCELSGINSCVDNYKTANWIKLNSNITDIFINQMSYRLALVGENITGASSYYYTLTADNTNTGKPNPPQSGSNLNIDVKKVNNVWNAILTWDPYNYADGYLVDYFKITQNQNNNQCSKIVKIQSASNVKYQCTIESGLEEGENYSVVITPYNSMFGDADTFITGNFTVPITPIIADLQAEQILSPDNRAEIILMWNGTNNAFNELLLDGIKYSISPICQIKDADKTFCYSIINNLDPNHLYSFTLSSSLGDQISNTQNTTLLTSSLPQVTLTYSVTRIDQDTKEITLTYTSPNQVMPGESYLYTLTDQNDEILTQTTTPDSYVYRIMQNGATFNWKVVARSSFYTYDAIASTGSVTIDSRPTPPDISLMTVEEVYPMGTVKVETPSWGVDVKYDLWAEEISANSNGWVKVQSDVLTPKFSNIYNHATKYVYQICGKNDSGEKCIEKSFTTADNFLFYFDEAPEQIAPKQMEFSYYLNTAYDSWDLYQIASIVLVDGKEITANCREESGFNHKYYCLVQNLSDGSHSINILGTGGVRNSGKLSDSDQTKAVVNIQSMQKAYDISVKQSDAQSLGKIDLEVFWKHIDILTEENTYFALYDGNNLVCELYNLDLHLKAPSCHIFNQNPSTHYNFTVRASRMPIGESISDSFAFVSATFPHQMSLKLSKDEIKGLMYIDGIVKSSSISVIEINYREYDDEKGQFVTQWVDASKHLTFSGNRAIFSGAKYNQRYYFEVIEYAFEGTKTFYTPANITPMSEKLVGTHIEFDKGVVPNGVAPDMIDKLIYAQTLNQADHLQQLIKADSQTLELKNANPDYRFMGWYLKSGNNPCSEAQFDFSTFKADHNNRTLIACWTKSSEEKDNNNNFYHKDVDSMNVLLNQRQGKTYFASKMDEIVNFNANSAAHLSGYGFAPYETVTFVAVRPDHSIPGFQSASAEGLSNTPCAQELNGVKPNSVLPCYIRTDQNGAFSVTVSTPKAEALGEGIHHIEVKVHRNGADLSSPITAQTITNSNNSHTLNMVGALKVNPIITVTKKEICLFPNSWDDKTNACVAPAIQITHLTAKATVIEKNTSSSVTSDHGFSLQIDYTPRMHNNQIVTHKYNIEISDVWGRAIGSITDYDKLSYTLHDLKIGTYIIKISTHYQDQYGNSGDDSIEITRTINLATTSKAPSFTDIPLKKLLQNIMRQRDIIWLAKTGITVGANCEKPTKTKKCIYMPWNTVNRGAMADFMYKFVGKQSGGDLTQQAKWFKNETQMNYLKKGKASTSKERYNHILWLAKTGITMGCKANSKNIPTAYCPNKSVNRSSMAQFMYHLVGDPNSVKDEYSNVLYPDPHYKDPKDSNRTLAYYEKLISGDKVLKKMKTMAAYRPRYWSVIWLVKYNITLPDDQKKFNPNNPVNRGSMAQFLHRLYFVLLTAQSADSNGLVGDVGDDGKY